MTMEIDDQFKLMYNCIASKTCVKRQLSKRPKIGFRDQLLFNAGQKNCRMGAFCNTFDLH